MGDAPASEGQFLRDPNGHVDEAKAAISDDEYAVTALRNLIYDICNQNGGGHGGSAVGMAAIGVALFKHVMRYSPLDPTWFDRDRFVLSNGKLVHLIAKGSC